MANFALNYSFSRNLNIPLDEDAVKALRSDVVTYAQTKSKCYAGQLFSVTGDTTDNNGLYIAVTTGENALVIKLASQDALDAVAQSAGKIDKIQLNGTDLTINDKVVNIDLSTYATIEYVDTKISGLTELYAPKAEFEEVQKKVEEITSTGGEPNVQSDWNTIDSEADSFIKNKPDLTVFATKTDLNNSEAAANGYTDDEIAKLSDVYASKSVVETLVGEDADKSARAIAAEEVAKIVASADTDFDTLKEIADWIANDTTGSAQMSNDITNLKAISADTRLDALEKDTHTHDNKALLDTYTQTEADLADAVAKKHEHSNLEVLEGVTAVKVAAWDAAEKNAKDYADSLASNYDAAGAAADALTEAKKYVDEQGFLTEHQDISNLANKSEVTEAEGRASAYTDAEIAKLAEVYDVKGAAADAEMNAKNYADSLAKNYDVAGASESALTVAKGYTDDEIAKLSDVYDVKGSAESALTEAKGYTDDEIAKLSDVYDTLGSANSAAANALVSARTYTDDEIGKLDSVYEPIGAEQNAKDYADSLASNYDAAGAAESALTQAKEYAEGLATNYDAAGAAITAAESALTVANGYTDDEIAKLSDVYDTLGSAESALTEAKKYTDDKLVDYATQSYVTEQIVSAMTGGEIELTGYAKVEDVKSQVASAKTEAIEAASAYTDAEISKLSDVYASKSVVETLVGEDADKSARAIAAEEVAKVVADAPEAYDTLKDIADYIANDITSAASLVNRVVALEEVDADSRLEALEALSGNSHSHDNKALLDTYTQTEEDLADAVAKKHEHTNKEVLDGITSDKVSAWDAAEQNAKDYADGLVENLKPYTGGTAVDIADYEVSVKVAEDEKNFLNVNESNELEVTEITLDAAKTSKDIVVEGGQWADMVKTVYTGGTVPAGTTWESFLEAMLCVEKFAGTISTSSAFTVSCGNINPGIDKSGTVEVGTKVTLNKTVANATTASQSLTAKTFTYGYKLGEDGTLKSSTAYTETLTPTLKESNSSLKITFSGFVDNVNSGSAISEKTGTDSIDAVEMYAMKGTNKVTVYQTGDTYTSSSAVTAGTIYVATNLKNYYKSDKVNMNTYTPSFVSMDKTASDSTEYTVTGAHKYFIGDITDYSADYWDTDRSSVVRGLKTSDWATAATISNVSHTFKLGTKQQTVVVPSTYSSVSGKDVNNGDVAFNLVKTFDFTNAQGYISSYKVFVAPAADGLGADSTIKITIK